VSRPQEAPGRGPSTASTSRFATTAETRSRTDRGGLITFDAESSARAEQLVSGDPVPTFSEAFPHTLLDLEAETAEECETRRLWTS
jgi:hypothetical protein